MRVAGSRCFIWLVLSVCYVMQGVREQVRGTSARIAAAGRSGARVVAAGNVTTTS